MVPICARICGAVGPRGRGAAGAAGAAELWGRKAAGPQRGCYLIDLCKMSRTDGGVQRLACKTKSSRRPRGGPAEHASARRKPEHLENLKIQNVGNLKNIKAQLNNLKFGTFII